jgi:hypothetical protein
MNRYENLLVVGGSGRNVGKTELVCRIIQKVSANLAIYALKVSAISPDTGVQPAPHRAELGAGLFEEHRADTDKDTSRMLRAGADRVFYLHSNGAAIMEHIERFHASVPAGIPVICESNSLYSYINPGLFVLVQGSGTTSKTRIAVDLRQPDLTVVSNGVSGFPESDAIEYRDGGWWLTGRL